jgi:hypothetical protein
VVWYQAALWTDKNNRGLRSAGHAMSMRSESRVSHPWVCNNQSDPLLGIVSFAHTGRFPVGDYQQVAAHEDRQLWRQQHRTDSIREPIGMYWIYWNQSVVRIWKISVTCMVAL